MTDSKFYTAAAPLPLRQLAEIGEAELAVGGDPDRLITDVAPLQGAGPDHISFLDNRKYIDAFVASSAGACIVHPDLAPRAPSKMALLLSRSPYRSYALVAQALHPRPPVRPGIALSAVVDVTAVVNPSAEIGPGVVIGVQAEIGAHCRVDANAVIGAGVVIGEDTVIGAGASLSHCLIGRQVAIYPGVRIGQDGFGFAMDQRGHVRVPQLGRVIIGDDVEIGANTTIDRGSGPDTVIGHGCRIDNLVQIGHNVEIGAGSVIIAQVGIAGSVKLGEFVVLGGQCGISGHIKIGAGARIAAQSGIMGDVEPGAEMMGYPAVPIRKFWRQVVKLAKLAEGKG